MKGILNLIVSITPITIFTSAIFRSYDYVFEININLNAKAVCYSVKECVHVPITPIAKELPFVAQVRKL